MEPDSDRIIVAIQTLFRLGSSRRIHQQQSTAAGISISQQALRVLERVLESDSTTPGQLANRLELDPAAITRLLRQLEQAGMVRRGRNPDDGRVSTVEATDQGRATFTRLREVIWGQVRRTLAGWSEEDIANLGDLLGRLVSDVQREPYRQLEPDDADPAAEAAVSP